MMDGLQKLDSSVNVLIEKGLTQMQWQKLYSEFTNKYKLI